MKLASVERILEILPHPNADRLELAKVLGWQVVVKKGEFQAGELAVFIPIDTVLPREPWSEFLVDKNDPDKPIRLKTVRLRQEYSQGLLVSIADVAAGFENFVEREVFVLSSSLEGRDVGEALGITKYVKPVPAQLQGVVKGPFPTKYIQKTDEINLLSEPELLNEFHEQEVVVATKKADGSSCTILWTPEEGLEVCSRNLNLKQDESNSFWKAAVERDLEGLLPNCGGTGWAIQAELVGPSIQKNPMGLDKPALKVFNVKNLSTMKLLSWPKMVEFCQHFELEWVDQVEMLEFHRQFMNPEFWQRLANQGKYPNGNPAEGIVVRPLNPRWSNTIDRPLSFKVINQHYKE